MRKSTVKIAMIIVVLMGSILSVQQLQAQGCVAIRSMGGFCSSGSEGHVDTTNKWQLSINNRYFKSYKHFVGTDEQKQRQTAQSEVINHQYTTDVTIFHQVSSRWSLM